MFSIDEGIQGVKFARSVVEAQVKQKPIPSGSMTFFNQKGGVFVTLHTYPDRLLRGCIGIPEPILPLQKAIIEAGTSVTHDPRFPPLQEDELATILVEITLLTKPQQIEYKNPEELKNKITIGKDGLIIRYHGRSGLFLPQVPVEQGWDIETYLTNLCFKAGLPPDAWFDKDANLYSFQGQIFTEDKPNGEIREYKTI
jgi:uncharacterized protein